jgi:hypothetical protein
MEIELILCLLVLPCLPYQGPGFIGIYPFYYHHINKYVPNKSLTGFYKLFTTYLKEICEKVKLGQRVFWIGKQTLDKAKKGEFNYYLYQILMYLRKFKKKCKYISAVNSVKMISTRSIDGKFDFTILWFFKE